MRYDESVIEQVREANDIVDVVGQYVRLTKKGANYFGLCPFHGEKTASFSVSPRKQIYYCFGCGAGGNVINFLMEYENYSFTESLKSLADRAHIDLPEPSGGGEDKGSRERRRQLLDIHKDAAVFYYKQLQTPDGAAGYQYFRQKRRLSDETITHFGLGFAPKASDALYRHLKEKGWGDELLHASGLVTIQERGIRDKFWNRVMFPIMDINNHVIAFGGRVMGDGIPKYLNSPETDIFDKSAHLYGLNFARKSRRKFMLICEGYMDVIALHQAGFTNAVASLGTAFNEKHARLLKRYTDTVILTQDSDDAGTNAKLRAFPILYEAGLKVKVLDMGSYKDPDEFIRAEGPDAYEACIHKARNAFLFMIEVLRRGYDLSDPADKTAFYSETADRLCMFREPLERDNYIDSVSTEFMIPRDELKSLVDRRVETRGAGVETVRSMTGYTAPSAARKDRRQQESVELVQTAGFFDTAEQARSHRPDGQGGKENAESSMSLIRAERLLTAWLCERPDLGRYVFSHISPEDLSSDICREITGMLRDDPGSFTAAAFLDRCGEDEEKRKAAAAVFAILDSGTALEDMSKLDLEKGLTEAVRAVMNSRYDREIRSCGSDMTALGKLLQEKNRVRNMQIKIQ
ncbi:MAG: DNA primase [Lachnospiraceae bacterium]|nr:DNA primase [Lachnospiraceae bacterium]